MASAKSFQLEVVTPERVVLSSPVTFVAFPAYDGEMGVLANRAPLVAKLGTGIVRLEGPEGTRRLFVDGGFARMDGSTLCLLTEEAREPEAIDTAALEREVAEARSRKITDDRSFDERQRALARARAQRALLGKP
ncbi:MAG TPA: ATP synthase F1 subunit epsilon [Thermoanaerobaculia bacterium]|nr:ATP synthase F1 subunit epsilon [Thermoanaerobaculia bacterium]